MTDRADVARCSFPQAAALEPRFVEGAWYREAYRVGLAQTHLGPCELFVAIFAHHPAWMNAALRARGRAGALFGLRGSTRVEIAAPAREGPFAVGGRIGRWPIHALDGDQVVAGRDDKHLDFRVVVRRDLDAQPPSVVVATSCVVHNVFGRLYLLVILPLHRWGMRLLLQRAAAARRL